MSANIAPEEQDEAAAFNGNNIQSVSHHPVPYLISVVIDLLSILPCNHHIYTRGHHIYRRRAEG